MMTRRAGADLFFFFTLLFLAMLAELYFSIFIEHDFLILTTEEQIETFKEESFGIFAEYI